MSSELIESVVQTNNERVKQVARIDRINWKGKLKGEISDTEWEA